MKIKTGAAYLLFTALSGCTAVEPMFEAGGKEPLLKHVMLPSPASNSDAVNPGIGNVPYLTEEDGIQRRFLAVAFDDHESRPDLLHTVYFATASHNVSQAEMEALNANAAKLEQGVTLSGYADPRGGSRYNKHLSERRVESVRKALAGLGVHTEKECAYGENRLPDVQNCEE